MMARSRKYPVELLERATRLVFESGRPIAHVAADLGLPAETRNFTPHVTLARMRGVSPVAVADYLTSRGRLAATPFVADRFVLMSARDGVRGGPYVVEAEFPLG